MKLSLTESDMLKIWRRACVIEPLRLDCTADRTDGPDVDAILVDRMRAWYLDLLDNAPLSKLVQIDCVDSASVSFPDSGLAVVSAPESCRRIVSVRFSDWDFPVMVSDSAQLFDAQTRNSLAAISDTFAAFRDFLHFRNLKLAPPRSSQSTPRTPSAP